MYRHVLSALALAGALLIAPSSFAATLSNVLVTDNSAGEWGDGNGDDPDCGGFSPFGCEGKFFEDDSSVSVPNGWNEWDSSSSASGGTSFSADHDYYLATQSQNAIGTALYYNSRVDYSIDVDAINPAEEWELTINLSNIGTITHTDENAGFVEIQSSTSSLVVRAPQRISGTGGSFGGATSFGSDANFNDNGGSYNQAGSFTISGTGDSTVTFAIAFEIDTNSFGELSFGSGDSMCVNGGKAATGDGPNTNCSVGAGSGLNLTGTILQTNVPEPNTVILLGGLSLLAGLAIARRFA